MFVRRWFLSLVALAGTALALIVQTTPVAAQGIARCRIQETPTLSSLAGTFAFERCGELIGTQAAQRRNGQALGQWDKYWVLADTSKRVYWSEDQRFWTYAGLWDNDGDAIANSVDQCPQAAESNNRIFDTDGCPDTLADLVNASSDDMNSFWQSFFLSQHTTYTAPAQIISYARAYDDKDCGEMMLNNAAYCPRTHAIYYDVGFLGSQIDSIGDYAAVHVLAHEWGHAIQSQLNEPTRQIGIARELQADCFAGAYAAHAEAAGYLETGDIQEAAKALIMGGDPQGVPWFDRRAHGNASQRVGAFAKGLQFGASQCIRDY